MPNDVNCKHYDPENGWCKKRSDWSDPMPYIEYCPKSPCEYAEPIEQPMNDNDIITDSFESPIWQLPVHGAERTGNAYISQRSKYHCFVNNLTLCGKYVQNTNYYDDGISAESGYVAQNPDKACSRCYKKWKKEYCEVRND